jgi:hypothetical protein
MPNGSEIFITACPKQPKPILLYAFMYLILLSIITVDSAPLNRIIW